MQQIVKGGIRRLQIEEQLAHLSLGQLVRGLHGVEGLQPGGDLDLALESLGDQRQPVDRVDEVAQLRMQFVHGLDLEPQLVHQRDEEGHDVGNALAGVALVVANRDRTVLLDALEGGRTVQPELPDERVDGGEFVALHLLEGHLVLDQELGASGRVLLGRDAVPDVSLLQVLQAVDHRKEVGLGEGGIN